MKEKIKRLNPNASLFWALLALLVPSLASVANATTFSGTVLPREGLSSTDSMPLTLKNLRTSETKQIKIGRWLLGQNNWEGLLTNMADGDTVKAVVTDTTNGQKDSTYTIYGIYSEILPTMCLSGWAGQINKVGPNNLGFLTNDSAYAKICTMNDTLFGKFRIRDLSFWATRYTVAFDLTRMNPIPSNGTQAKIYVRAVSHGTFAGFAQGNLDHSRWDADVVAESLNLAPSTLYLDAFLSALTSPPESVRIGYNTGNRQIIAGNNTDLARITRNVVSKRRRNNQTGPSLDSMIQQVNLEPSNFPGDESLLTYLPITFARVDSGLNSIIYAFAENDSNPGNNQIIQPVFVKVYDAAAKEVLSPENTIIQGSAVQPRGRVRNEGNVTLYNIPIIMNINSGKGNNYYGEYSDTFHIDLAPGQEQEIAFGNYNATTLGTFQTNLIINLNSLQDDSLGNNIKSGTGFEVINPPATWKLTINGFPAYQPPHSPKYVKDGSSSAALQSLAKIIAFKGNNTNEVVFLDSTGFIEFADSMIYGYKPTAPTEINKKRLKDGSDLCSDGFNAFATKGGTNEFWQYTQRWISRGFVPSTNKLGAGTAIAYQNGKVYILAGNQKTGNNFFVYDTVTKTISSLAKAPLDNRLAGTYKPWKAGTNLAVTKNGLIAAIKGGDKNNPVYYYEPIQDTWSTNPETIPQIHTTIGKKKKFGKGADIVNAAGDLYAITGNGSPAFWKKQGSLWVPKDIIPRAIENGNKSVPKGGASLSYLKDGPYYGHIYLAKGNITLEFWRYGPIPDTVDKKGKMRYSFQEIYTPNLGTVESRPEINAPVNHHRNNDCRVEVLPHYDTYQDSLGEIKETKEVKYHQHRTF